MPSVPQWQADLLQREAARVLADVLTAILDNQCHCIAQFFCLAPAALCVCDAGLHRTTWQQGENHQQRC